MEVLLAFVIGGVYASGIYMMLRRSLVKLIIGIALLSNAANLLIFTASGLTAGKAPLIPKGMDRPVEATADPLPQALILTAIVIGFGVMAFALTLFHRASQEVNTDDLDALRATDT